MELLLALTLAATGPFDEVEATCLAEDLLFKEAVKFGGDVIYNGRTMTILHDFGVSKYIKISNGDWCVVKPEDA